MNGRDRGHDLAHSVSNCFRAKFSQASLLLDKELLFSLERQSCTQSYCGRTRESCVLQTK